ncbi:3-oxoacyl-ACP synthase [Paracidovorax avenae]|uniref:beta-ketoacyl synthase chain length factor n=1 Tax=Paracidovorax avenae TaxID=80867 RepID=UPI000D22BB41|nr:3-oxoacyl-ACP synthase [Paracidovorax avenae]
MSMSAFSHAAPAAGALRMHVPLARWACWPAPGDTAAQAAPRADFLEPAMRRRAGALARAALQVAHDCAGHLPSVRIVFASRHGELGRTTQMLQELAEGQELSPMAFSMSVLNAIAGVYSIATQDRAPATAVSAAEGTFGMALLEAGLQWADDPASPVLLLYADEPASPVYGPVAGDLSRPLVLALLLDSLAAESLCMEMANTPGTATATAQPEAFLPCLLGPDEARWTDGRQQWTWRRGPAA